MSINNSRDFLAYAAEIDGFLITDHLLRGGNRQLAPGTYVPDWDANAIDSVTFQGTKGRDALFGGAGEIFTFFLGTRGDDLYGASTYTTAYADYSGARHGVFVDMSYRGSRTFTDADGEQRTVAVVGRAHDGFGGMDYFAAFGEPGLESFSSVSGVFGSSRADVMIGGGGFDDFYGGGGDDLLVSGFAHGGGGDDLLIGRSDDGSSVALLGEAGDDLIFGTDGPGRTDVLLVGGAGDDRIFAGAGDDRHLTGNEGDDFIDAGAGDDFLDGGVGRDTLLSGAGNDTINPDAEYFQSDPDAARDGARDVIRVTRADLGAFTDTVLFNAFEEDRDQIRFGDAVRGGAEFRVYREDVAALPGRRTTILQIDWNGDGLGDAVPDSDDYFLVVQGADLSQRHDYLLT